MIKDRGAKYGDIYQTKCLLQRSFFLLDNLQKQVESLTPVTRSFKEIEEMIKAEMCLYIVITSRRIINMCATTQFLPTL